MTETFPIESLTWDGPDLIVRRKDGRVTRFTNVRPVSSRLVVPGGPETLSMVGFSTADWDRTQEQQ